MRAAPAKGSQIRSSREVNSVDVPWSEAARDHAPVEELASFPAAGLEQTPAPRQLDTASQPAPQPRQLAPARDPWEPCNLSLRISSIP